jgi:hypothetical protein
MLKCTWFRNGSWGLSVVQAHRALRVSFGAERGCVAVGERLVDLDGGRRRGDIFGCVALPPAVVWQPGKGWALRTR